MKTHDIPFHSASQTDINSVVTDPPYFVILSLINLAPSLYFVTSGSGKTVHPKNYPTIQNPRPAPRIQFQIYFDMSVRAKSLSYIAMLDQYATVLCHAEGLETREVVSGFAPPGADRPPHELYTDTFSDADLLGPDPNSEHHLTGCISTATSWIWTLGSEITGFNEKLTPSPSLGIDASSVSTQRERFPDRSPLTMLPQNLSSFATQGPTSRRIYFRQASSQTHFSCDFAILQVSQAPGPHQRWDATHTRLQIRDWHGR
ncbi:hypothetical protein DFP72DRAFT_1069135 [Ephemerocybe angulata]|uniref:Uncharacterized protein n=1 Tax=Ephemerocybe angulata TaxID=980116 RepID=A0A8H6HVF5_9AGAR|nr:hypothetical protein DFP72DRAFT_1069135 [Tulosesus angulatus]